MQDVDLGEADLPHEVELEHEGPGGIFLFNVGEDVVRTQVPSGSQVLGVAAPLQLLHRRMSLSTMSKIQRDRREPEHGTTTKTVCHSLSLAQVVQDGRADESKDSGASSTSRISPGWDVRFAVLCLSARRPGQAWTAQINKGYVEAGQKL